MKLPQRKLSLAEQGRIARRLSTLLGAGISPVEAVTFMKKPIFARIVRDISKGRRCSDAFRASKAFDRSLIEMIRIGERSGTLAEAFFRAGMSLESRDAISRKITGAMIYPGFIALATAGIAGFLVVYIFPKIIPLVTGMGIPLPFLTRVLMVVSATVIGKWPVILAAVAASFFIIKILWKYSRFFRKCMRCLMFAMPIFGPIFRGRILVEIFKPLGLLLEHGELVPDALISVSKSLSHESYAQALLACAASVTDGTNLASSLGSNPSNPSVASIQLSFISPLFPPMVTDFIEMGERTGGVAAACGHIASIYEGEVEDAVKRITQIIEPALMLGMGLTVGSIALSIIMPIYAITANLTK